MCQMDICSSTHMRELEECNNNIMMLIYAKGSNDENCCAIHKVNMISIFVVSTNIFDKYTTTTRVSTHIE